jgi:CheY-specific phosphatase CheX
MYMNEQICLESVMLDAAREVFETAAFLEIQPCEDAGQKIDGDSILGSITFKGAMEGCLAVRCGLACARSVAVAMLGMDPSESLSQDEIADSVGEVTNMVLGSFKARVRDTIGNLEVSIPSVVTGQQLEGTLGGHASKAMTRVLTADGNLIEICLFHKVR